MSFVEPLPSALPVDAQGGKALGLSRLLDAGARVPPAFVVVADALDAQLHAIDGELARLRDAPLSDALSAALDDALSALGAGPWAVRSSGVYEDDARHSFAGMHDSVLGCATRDAVHDAVRRCWASAFSSRAGSYRSASGLGDRPPRLAVVVQRMVQAQVSGICFTCDPIAARDDVIVVEATPGTGEDLAAGRTSPDRVELTRSLVVTSRAVASERPACLDDALACEVAAVALRAEAGAPVDVEWAADDDGVWLLQARPITTSRGTIASTTPAPSAASVATRDERALAPTVEDGDAIGLPLPVGIDPARIVWSNTNARELLPDVATPMTISILEPVLDNLLGPLIAPFGVGLRELGVIGTIGGRVYFNVNAVVGWLRAVPVVGRTEPALLARALGGNGEELAAAIAQLRPSDLPQRTRGVATAFVGGARAAWRLWSRRAVDARAALAQLKTWNDGYATVELTTMLDDKLLSHLERLLRDPFGDVADLDGHTMLPAAVGMACQGLLPVLAKRWLRDDDDGIAWSLLQGIGGLQSADAGLALWKLAELARSSKLVSQLHGDFDDVRNRLEGSPEGRRFMAAFSAFVRRHGHHARGEADVALPRWAEQPAYVLSLLRAIAANEGRSVAADEENRKKVRARRIEETAARLSAWRRRVFLGVLERAARGAAVRENAKSEAVRRLFLVRQSLLEVGQRLVKRGALDVVDDVFFLVRAELVAALAGELELRDRVRARRARHEACAGVEPPAVVVGAWDGTPAARPVSTGMMLSGLGASPGVVEGHARVVQHADDAEMLQPGEVLVAPFTDPGWTPYFLSASAVVTDFGGMLSHGSVVAREYGLPAVVNVAVATQRIRTGQRVRVDGTRGEVQLLDDA